MSDIIEEVKRTPMKHRQKVSFVVLGLVILASGFGLGASTTFFYLQDQDRIRPPRDPNEPRLLRFDPVEKWATQYKFTDEQKEQVRAALERQHKVFRELWETASQKMGEAKDVLLKDMNDILTPEQFEPWHEEFKERLKRRMRGRGRPSRNKGHGPPGDGHQNRDRDGDTRTEASPE